MPSGARWIPEPRYPILIRGAASHASPLPEAASEPENLRLLHENEFNPFLDLHELDRWITGNPNE